MAEQFSKLPVKKLQEFLKERNVTYSGSRKSELVRLCTLAERNCFEIDPD
jgi:hypothetical protein